MRTSYRPGSWYIPGRLYDLAFGGLLRGVRKRVAWAVREEGLYPWLDVCCGTGSQFRGHEPGDGSGWIFGLDKNSGMVRYAAARAAGLPFVCGDAARLPFKGGMFRAITISFGLHDKSAGVRRAMMREVRRVLSSDGRLIAVDFENPWNAKSRAGAFFVQSIELLAGREHYRNGRDFLRRGGLRAFIRENGFEEMLRRDVEAGSLGLVIARLFE